MQKYTIYHNPKCSKSRETLALLERNNIKPAIRRYLDNPLTKEELSNIVAILKVKPITICRVKETLFKEIGLTKESSDNDILEAIFKNPSLLERPIVIKDGKIGAIGRPVENILQLLSPPKN